jgi:hypothetical protein
VQRLLVALQQVPPEQRSALLNSLPKEETAKVAFSLANVLESEKGLEILESLLMVLDATAFMSAMQIVPRETLEKLILARLLDLDASKVKRVLERLTLQEVMVLAGEALIPRSGVILAAFLGTLTPARQKEIFSNLG